MLKIIYVPVKHPNQLQQQNLNPDLHKSKPPMLNAYPCVIQTQIPNQTRSFVTDATAEAQLRAERRRVT